MAGAAEEGFARRVTTLGALADPVRRALYRFVSDQDEAVSREQAAEGVEVPRHTAKFHLDRLVDEGLLVTEFRRLTGRSGPGAGRPAKLYRRSAREVSVSLPHRRYDLAAEVLADAIERSLDGTPMAEAVTAAADAAGRLAVDAAPEKARTRRGRELDRVAVALAPFGYEPRVDAALDLANCPFDRLAADHRDLVCGMNLAFVGSVADQLGCVGVRAEQVPGTEGCCVRVVPSD
ncbi:helix-turn-helix transcriptional regulator [Nocardioides sp.]|uniref:helix-turn-helix transcriptional regulator n=1 Tax=Nocardioides sp. TaxID=35761 RepID=UPI002D7EA847|nr:helix-turn-helix domain-containing protein [Nocardioides sp.]HET8962098.1 helix-turn-helix domain-containing protein [Nocardioides sp.]